MCPATRDIRISMIMVNYDGAGGGLEPPRLAAPEPKSGASTNFATPATERTSAGMKRSITKLALGVREVKFEENKVCDLPSNMAEHRNPLSTLLSWQPAQWQRNERRLKTDKKTYCRFETTNMTLFPGVWLTGCSLARSNVWKRANVE